MLLYFRNKLDELRIDDIRFFRIAHQWCFNRDVAYLNEVSEYRLHSILPKYVIRYIKHLQKTEKQ